MRVAQVVEAEVLPAPFPRPADFDLAAFWEQWCREYETQSPYVARVRVAPEVFPALSYYLDERARRQPGRASHPDADGWVMLDLPFESFVTARTRLLGLGRAVEVLEPEPLRKSVLDFAAQVVDLYRPNGPWPG